MTDKHVTSRQPSRIVLYDKDYNLLHDADTPEKVQAVNRMLSGQIESDKHESGQGTL